MTPLQQLQQALDQQAAILVHAAGGRITLDIETLKLADRIELIRSPDPETQEMVLTTKVRIAQ